MSRKPQLDRWPFVIAELGVNHDGSPRVALELAKAAHEAGASAIKLQLFDPDLLMSKAAMLAVYQRSAGEEDPIDMLRRLQLTLDDMEPVVEFAETHGMYTVVTVFSHELVRVSQRIEWDFYKTASPDIVNKPLLDALHATGRPLIVSTGASTLGEVERAIDWLAPLNRNGTRDSSKLAILHCVSSYPTPDDAAALGGIHALREVYDGAVGYSDHTMSADTGAFAVAAGAVILEKHLTYDRGAKGPDHAASLEPAEFAEYVRSATRALQMLGAISKAPLACEQDVRQVSRQSLTLQRNLPAGHVLVREDLTVKRPGTGIEPFRLDDVIGRRLIRGVEADMPLLPGDLA